MPISGNSLANRSVFAPLAQMGLLLPWRRFSAALLVMLTADLACALPAAFRDASPPRVTARLACRAVRRRVSGDPAVHASGRVLAQVDADE